MIWITANYTWYIFFRHQNLKYDDANEGNDQPTRIISAFLFCIQISIMLYVIYKYFFIKRNPLLRSLKNNNNTQ